MAQACATPTRSSGREGQLLPLKADPVALQADLPPSTASVVADPTPFAWTDRDWIETRAQRQSPEAPIAIYEVHPESWAEGGARLGHARRPLDPARLRAWASRMSNSCP
ncbi:MAG: hypothetical protein RML45_00270 [Acetobacteraceae bacterium]|nr:hypothetical protein [Acetobacteraceae bacterium]